MTAPPDPNRHPLEGVRLGGWQVGPLIGRGGLGTVFQATAGDGTLAAIKAFDLANDPHGDLAQAFQREAESTRVLDHPDIVKVLATGQRRSLAYIVMEYVRGHDLARYGEPAHALPDTTVLAVAGRLAGALAHAHARGIVHRDIKPANILVDWASDQVKVCDFGLARLGDAFRSRTGVMSGTPAYMSPEQLLDAPIDGRADLYALGVVMFELLARRLPHRAGSLGDLLRTVAHDDAPRLTAFRPDLPDAVADLVARLLARRADQRPRDAADVAHEIDALRGLSSPP